MWKKVFHDHRSEFFGDSPKEYQELYRKITTLAEHKMGYPVSLLSYLGIINNYPLGIIQSSLANVLLNNVGDPYKDSETSLMEVKAHEREIIRILTKYYGMPEHSLRGYVTTGGTEGNFAGLWWSKRYLISASLESLINTDDTTKLLLQQEQELVKELNKIPIDDFYAVSEHLKKLIQVKDDISNKRNVVQQIRTPTIFYAKGPTHYSVPKVAEILHLYTRPVAANDDGSINVSDLRKELVLHSEIRPDSPVIVVANIGTTVTGAIDDVKRIREYLEESIAPNKFTIHMDGALMGFVLPVIKPFGDVENYFSSIGANTLAVSAHKFPGLPQPCGIILAHLPFFEKGFENTERNIDYVGNIVDITISGSRSGFNVLLFYHALISLGLNHDYAKLRKLVKSNIETATFLYEQLSAIFGAENVRYPHHFNVMFPRPSAEFARKYQLMLTGEWATVCVLTNVTKRLINQFIVDLKEDLQKRLNQSVQLNAANRSAP